MCKFSATCKLDCDDALKCPAVYAAFGPVTRAGGGSNWWDDPARTKPRVRRNSKGVKLCSVADCNEPRKSNYHLCPAHYNEYGQQQYRKNRTRILEYQHAQRREMHVESDHPR
jgi:hypothetical protein